MNYDLITLASRLRKVETIEQLAEVKTLAESFMTREKNYALLTLLAVAEEFGDQEVVDSVDRLHKHLNEVLKK
ncbi:MAG: hypothetical protein IKA87_04240 [Lentisphaeria bacterium]|nr:hypothetical protein [Lentisphaeria bacterium]